MLQPDGVHLNAGGYAALPQLFFKTAAIPSKSKVVCLGDSITYGQGVSESENYPSVLARLLNE